MRAIRSLSVYLFYVCGPALVTGSFGWWKDTYRLPSFPNDDRLDNVSNAVDAVQFIYADVLCLLIRRIHDWASGGGGGDGSMESIESYLGFDAETVDLLNVSMTELLHQQRNGNIAIANLEQLFYYSCDLKYTFNTDMTEELNYLMEKHSYYVNVQVVEHFEVAVIVDGLKSDLNSLGNRTDVAYGVTIPSMKMRMLASPSTDELVRIIQNRPYTTLYDMYVIHLVKSYESDSGGRIVNSSHVKVLGVLLVHLFGYVKNHFDLLFKLRTYLTTFNEYDVHVVEQFKPFMDAFLSILFERYVVFKNDPVSKLFNVLFAVKHFLNPVNVVTTNGNHYLRDGTKSECYFRNEPISMKDYYEIFENPDEFGKQMRTLMKNAVKILLQTFKGENENNWNAPVKINYEEYNVNKLVLLHLMTDNSKNAIDILTKLIREITLEKNYTIDV